MTTINGIATQSTGDPADKVRVFRWPDGELVSAVSPSPDGSWEVTIPETAEYGISYLAAGCIPITHGPYLIEATVELVADEYFDKVVTLLHFDGATGSSDFKDESGFYHVITIEGTPTLEATSVFGQAGEFIVNEGLIFPDHPSLRMEDQDFTIEGFFQPASPGALSIVYMKGLNTSDGMLLSFSTSQIFMRNVDNKTDLIKTVSLDSNTFYHVAFQRVGNLRQIWLDGQKVAEDSVIFNHSSTEPMTIGGYHPGVASGAYLFDGRIDEFRITKGVARYTESFTPPIGPFPNVGPA